MLRVTIDYPSDGELDDEVEQLYRAIKPATYTTELMIAALAALEFSDWNAELGDVRKDHKALIAELRSAVERWIAGRATDEAGRTRWRVVPMAYAVCGLGESRGVQVWASSREEAIAEYEAAGHDADADLYVERVTT